MSPKKFDFTYQNRSGTDWKPETATAVRYQEGEPIMSHRSPSGRKPISAKPMSKEEFESYKASGVLGSRGGYDKNGKWQYPVSVPSSTKDLIDTGQSAVSSTASSTYVRCYESHPPLDLGNGLKIYGGSCHSPIVTDADIYVALDGGYKNTERHWPWHKRHCQEIRFPITDMSTPEKPEAFVQLIAWLVEQIKAGKKVHVGCIGGHGRTGMILVGVYRALNPDVVDAIQAVRAKYCKKVVESTSQVAFLVKYTGCSTAEATKSFTSTSSKSSKGGSTAGWWDSKGKYQGGSTANDSGVAYATPMNSAKCIWGPKMVKA